RSDETIERGVVVTREVLRAISTLAHSRGATPLILVPQFGAETPVERKLRQRVLDEGGFSYVWVELDAAWRLPWDRHPNPRAAQAVGAAIRARLREWRCRARRPWDDCCFNASCARTIQEVERPEPHRVRGRLPGGCRFWIRPAFAAGRSWPRPSRPLGRGFPTSLDEPGKLAARSRGSTRPADPQRQGRVDKARCAGCARPTL